MTLGLFKSVGDCCHQIDLFPYLHILDQDSTKMEKTSCIALLDQYHIIENLLRQISTGIQTDVYHESTQGLIQHYYRVTLKI